MSLKPDMTPKPEMKFKPALSLKTAFRSCSHEPELKALLAAGQWPAAAPEELREHLAQCRSCSDLALLTSSFQAERAAASFSAQLPPPGLLWWRAQLRRRNAALEHINRPLLGAQILALTAVLLAASAFALFFWRDAARWLAGLQPVSPASTHPAWLWSPTAATQWFSLLWTPGYVLPAIVVLVLAGGVAVYLTHERN
jgi:predicted anti-sigma-YlaC factor YlaD